MIDLYWIAGLIGLMMLIAMGIIVRHFWRFWKKYKRYLDNYPDSRGLVTFSDYYRMHHSIGGRNDE